MVNGARVDLVNNGHYRIHIHAVAFSVFSADNFCIPVICALVAFSRAEVMDGFFSHRSRFRRHVTIIAKRLAAIQKYTP